MSSKDNVRNTRILQLGDTRLLPVVERHIAHICLHLLEVDLDMMARIILDGRVGGKLDEIVRFEGDDVGEEVPSLKHQILDDEVKTFVGVFDARDGYITDL